MLILFLSFKDLHSEELGNNYQFVSYTSELKINAQKIVRDYFIFKEAYSLEDKDDEKALQLYLEIMDKYPYTPNYKKAFRRIIEIKLKKGSKDLLDFFERYIEKYPSEYDLIYRVSLYLLKNNEESKGVDLLTRLLNVPDSFSIKAYKKLLELNWKIKNDIKLNLIKKLYEKRLYEEIIELDKIDPFSGKEEKSFLIKSLFKTKRYKKVSELTVDESDLNLKELYILSLLRLGERNKFLSEIEFYLKNRIPAFFELYLIYADLIKNEGKYEEALSLLNILSDSFPEKREIILWKEVLYYLGINNYEKAEIRLKELIKKFPQNKYFFWLSKVCSYQGKDGKIYLDMLKDEEDYYYTKVKGVSIKNKSFYLEKKLSRVDALILLNMFDSAREELAFYLSRNPNDDIHLIKYLKQLNLYNYILRAGIKLNDIYLKYPLAYSELIFDLSEKFEVDSFLSLAVMREESNFRKDAISTAKAYGLMQIILPTAKKYKKNISEKELLMEEKNIEIGIRYLSNLIGRFKDLEIAVSAYNAGESNVERWLANGYKDIDEFIENIPFFETRNYVKKVMRSYYIYRNLYGR